MPIYVEKLIQAQIASTNCNPQVKFPPIWDFSKREIQNELEVSSN
jgi:hypothetical protein